MTVEKSADQLLSIQPTYVQPYASVILLKFTGDSPSSAVAQLRREVERVQKPSRKNQTAKIVASGFVDSTGFVASAISREAVNLNDIELDGFVTEFRKPSSWVTGNAPFMDAFHELTVIVRQGDLLALHCDSRIKSQFQHRLDREPRPSFERIDEGVLNAAFLQGQAKYLWLQGIHPRRATKADSKSLGGESLQDALRPLDDGTFAYTSARVEQPDDPSRIHTKGTLGTNPGDSSVWRSSTESLTHYLLIALELLENIRRTISQGKRDDRPIPILACKVRGLRGVTGAYDIAAACPEDMAGTPNWSPEAERAAETLRRVTFNVIGESHGASFSSDVGMDGTTSGRIRCTPRDDKGRILLKFGFDPDVCQHDPDPVREILWALQFDEILTIYYESGHAIQSRAAYTWEPSLAPFPNWEWVDFSGFDIKKEKPGDCKSSFQDIHEGIGEKGDTSLFSWVVKCFAKDGLLTCDDGPGEVADFIHYDENERVTFIHVKAANSDLPGRGVSVIPYEAVQSQAEKNLIYADPKSLIRRLESPLVARPGCWSYGERQPNRADLIEFLKSRKASAETRIAIVQPHLRRSAYEHARGAEASNKEQLKIRLLETLLHSGRQAIAGVVNDLYVVSST